MRAIEVKGAGTMRSLLAILPFSVAYIVVGIVTADLAASAASMQGRSSWRLLAWGLSFLVYGAQLLLERVRANSSTSRTALHASGAVAIAALVLAATGPVRTHWGTSRQQGTLMTLLLWPLLTGLASFVVTLGAAAVIGRAIKPPHPKLQKTP